MTISAKLLNGNIINRDADFSKYIETVSEAGVIEGFQVSANAVAKGKARVPCERSNGEKLFVLVLNDNNIPIDGNGDVYINIEQSHIDNGELSSDDGTGIATIEVGTMPSKNALKLAVKNGSSITDERNMLKKIQELDEEIAEIGTRMTSAEEAIDELEEKGAIDHLEESGMVGEKYLLTDTLFHQETPLLANCTLDCNIGDVADNTQIHIQRLASGTASNKLKLKIKKVGAPTQNVVVEVRVGVKVDVSSQEAYWYGDTVIATGGIGYTDITTDYAEMEITMDNEFGGNAGDLLDIVIYQTNNTVNSTNYYVIGCDSTQYSEAFSYVAYNGTNYTRSRLMPYCSSVGFAQSLLCKVNLNFLALSDSTERGGNKTDTRLSYYVSRSGVYKIDFKSRIYSTGGWLSVGGVGIPLDGVYESHSLELEFIEGDIISFYGYRCFIKDVVITEVYKNRGDVVIFKNTGILYDSQTYSFTVRRESDIFFSRNSYTTTTGSQYAPELYISINGTQIYSENFYGKNGQHTLTISADDLNGGDIITMQTVRSHDTQTQGVPVMIQNMQVVQDGTTIELRPQTTEEIGKIGTGVSFGECNGIFKGGQFVGIDTTVTTGTIALGNAVGYLEVNYLGEIYKIPYYK